MNGISYLVDTNCFIYLLDENALLAPFYDKGWAFSFITEIELLSHGSLSTKGMQVVRDMLTTCYKVQHNQHITEPAIELRRSGSLKIPDAIIGATALHLQLPLLTADKAFARIKEIDSIILELS